MFGCDSRAAAWASRRKRRSASGWASRSLRKTFKATMRSRPHLTDFVHDAHAAAGRVRQESRSLAASAWRERRQPAFLPQAAGAGQGGSEAIHFFPANRTPDRAWTRRRTVLRRGTDLPFVTIRTAQVRHGRRTLQAQTSLATPDILATCHPLCTARAGARRVRSLSLRTTQTAIRSPTPSPGRRENPHRCHSLDPARYAHAPRQRADCD